MAISDHKNSEAFLTKVLHNNAIGPLNLTRALLPYMRGKGTGTLLFLSSFGAYFGSPGASAYVGAKGLLESMVPTLALEVAPFGLRTCIVTPGFFKTKVFTPGNILWRAPNPLPEYAEMNKIVQHKINAVDGQQPGDPRKAGDVVVEAVKGVGRCTGKELPLWLPLGADAFQAIRANSEAKLKVCDEWADIGSATNL